MTDGKVREDKCALLQYGTFSQSVVVRETRGGAVRNLNKGEAPGPRHAAAPFNR